MRRENEHHSKKKRRRLFKQCLCILLTVALVVTMAPILPGMNQSVYAGDELTGKTVKPAVVITGKGLLSDGAYSGANIGNEKSYTLDELKAMEEITQLYSTINTTPTKSIYLGKGISIDKLLQESNFPSEQYGTKEIDIVSCDGYTVKFDPAKTGDSATSGKPLKTPAFNASRSYFPNIATDNEDGAVEVETILAWERGGERGKPETIPATTDALAGDEAPLLLMVGQQNVWEQNNPLFNKAVNKVNVGEAIAETAVSIDGKSYTRAEIMMMDRADRSYTYPKGESTETVYTRGIPLAVLLNAYGDNDTVSFKTADNYPVGGFSMTVAELIGGNYILAYEKGADEANLVGIYETAKKDTSIYGFFTLYGDGDKPYKLIDSITVTPASGIDFVNSPYKHINNGGIEGADGPYDIDAITGATLTIEGPGVKSSVPLAIRELESQNAGAHSGIYTDSRDGADCTLQYEGIRLSYIVNNMTSGDNGIIMTDKAYKVLLKNRVRQTIAEFTLDQLAQAENAGSPVIIAYGTATTDNSVIAPFVYDGATGIKDPLDNDDGPIKVVYDKSVFDKDPNPGYTEFGNVAYIYVAEETSPRYKHDKAPYNTAENSEYVLTVTGDKIGREVNYTVKQLEDMVQYDTNGAPEADGMGYRGEYSMSNSTYWYVNEYEGVQLWKLLQKSGLASGEAAGTDKDTLVSFSATDNYKDFDKFTIEQISNPDLFKYYEKNPADLNDGTYKSNDAEDLRDKGYPILVAYGVNSYPYVIKNTLDGYMSGLSNDGGPLRIISGKMEYTHANGSKQAKLLDKIIVGEDKYYSTHKYNPNKNGVYQKIADTAALNVKVISGAGDDGTVLKDITYTVGELEDLIYDGTLTNAQLKEAKVKDFYEIYKNGNFFSDLYEGIDLPYFLENVVQLPGYKGTITFGDGTTLLSKNLEEVLNFAGCNATTNLSGLSPVLAYAKNGTPMVKDKNTDGYESKITLAAGTAYENEITVKNDGGPLAIMFPRETMDAATADSFSNVTSITINLSPDKYAHTESPYNTLVNNTITVSGEGTRLTEPKTFTVADIEGKQTLAVTGDYNIKKSTDSQSQTRYRGIPLYAFLGSTDVGLKPNADKVIVTCSDLQKYEFTLAEVYKSDYINGQNPAINNLKMILAYGSAAVTNPDSEDGKPLVQSKDADGYDEAYGNSGGPIRLVVGQTNTDDINSGKILKDVTSIEVTASEMVSWNHSSSPIYQQYLDRTFQFQVVDGSDKVLFDKTYTIGELEAMASLVERENITWVGTQEWEGINLWKFAIQEAGHISGVADPTSVNVYASDSYSKDLRSIFGIDALQNGIKDGEARIPIIIGYAVKGYPLVTDNNNDGYTSLADNGGGPLRLMTHGNQGACLWDTVKMVVKVGEAGTDPEPPTVTVLDPPLTIKGWGSNDITYAIGGTGGIINLTTGSGGKDTASYAYTTKEGAVNDSVVGIKLTDLLTHAGISGDDVRVSIDTTDGYKDKGGSYENITLADITAKDYFVAYDCNTAKIADIDGNNIQASLRIYRNYDDGSTWKNRVTNVSGLTITKGFSTYPADGTAGNLPLAGIRSIWMDDADGLWVSTYGGGVAHKAADASTFTIYNKKSDPALATAVISAVAVDKDGGVWMTQNASYTEPEGNRGVAYMKDGEITYFTELDNPKTIPNNYVQEIQIDDDGNVWFGSFGGLTKYNPTTGEWKTWDQSDGFPAMSIDNLILDNKGGVWCGFYPNGEGTEADPFVGGFAYMDKEGKITKYEYTADYDSALGFSLLAQVWVRDIAVDAKGGAWVVASGSYSNLPNVGGTVWYVDSTGQVTQFTGRELLGDALTGNSEVRMVTVDPDGGLWFGSSGDGVFHIAQPSKTAPLTITAQYNGKSGALPNSAVWNNIYSLDFVGNTLYAGSSVGLAYKTFTFSNTGGDPGSGEIPVQYDLAINGDIGKSTYFTISQLKNASGIHKLTKSYSWLNSYGTTGKDTFEGIYIENLLKDVIGLGSNAKSITVKATDGYKRSFNLDNEPLGVYWTDTEGNKIMLAWKKNGADCNLQLIVGKKDEEHINKPMWVSDISTITINKSNVEPGSGSMGDYEGTKDPGKEEPIEVPITESTKSVVQPEIKLIDGVVASNVTTADINKALEEIKKNSATEGAAIKGFVEINATTDNSGKVSRAEISLAKSSIEAMAEGTNISAVIKTDLGDITLDPALLKEIRKESGSNVLINIAKADGIKLEDQIKAQISDRPILDITVSVNNKIISNFNGHTIKVGMPYKALDKEDKAKLVAIYLDGKEKGKPVKLSIYDSKAEQMLMRTNHLSLYSIGYNEVTFADIQGHWSKGNIELLAARDILKGKSTDRFDPEGSVTRAEFVTMLANSLDDIKISDIKSAGFDDVASGAWYADYVNWAVSKNIVSGYGNGKFGPNDKITREQMALMTDNFIKAMNYSLDTVNTKITFKDQEKINSWSTAAVTSMQQYGIINGNPDKTFAPQGTATRAQAATIVRGYIEALLK